MGDGDSRHPAGGFWYSHPHKGQCTDDMKIGDKNCTYKLHDITKAINASCMYEQIDKAVEASNTECFDKCEHPFNVTSECYLHCYSEATRQMSQQEMTKPWEDAFNGGCPEVKLPESPEWTSLMIEELLRAFNTHEDNP